MIRFFFIFVLTMCCLCPAHDFQTDTFETTLGPLEITFIGHGTLMFQCNDKVIQVDPWSRLADYSQFPAADLILLTHEHGDHLDVELLKKIAAENTTVLLTKVCAERFPGTVLQNGDETEWQNIQIQAVPAFNIQHKRSNGEPYHPKGRGNGYVLTFGDKRVYVAGDTENIPEMAQLQNIDIAFLPMNLPYTMSPEMVADAAKMFMPKILYPYHFGETDVNSLLPLLKDSGIEIRIRELK